MVKETIEFTRKCQKATKCKTNSHKEIVKAQHNTKQTKLNLFVSHSAYVIQFLLITPFQNRPCKTLFFSLKKKKTLR